MVWNSGFRKMVGQFQMKDAERFKREHLQEVAVLTTKDRIWLDVGVLFTICTKLWRPQLLKNQILLIIGRNFHRDVIQSAKKQ